MWRPVLNSWNGGDDVGRGIALSPLFTFGSKFTGSIRCCDAIQSVLFFVPLLGSVTKACMILRSIEELQHKPGMVSKTLCELCKVFPL